MIQSFLTTISRYSFTIYEQRILLHCVNHCQHLLRGKYIAGNLKRWEHPYSHDASVQIPIKAVLGEGDEHYSRVRDAVTALQKKTMQMYDTRNKTWYSSPLILQARHRERSGMLTVIVPTEFYTVLFDFTAGWSQYDINVALSLRLPASVRLYALINHASKPLEYSIEYLKQMFGVQDNYKQTRDFILKVIEPAAKELKASGANYFEYERVFRGRAVVALRLFRKIPVDKAQSASRTAAELQQRVGQEILVYLVNEAGFTYKELSHYTTLLQRISTHPLGSQIVYDICHRARKRRKDKGYIIAALRSEADSLPHINNNNNK